MDPPCWYTTGGSGFGTGPGVENLRLGPDSVLTRGGPAFPHLENQEVGLGKSFPMCDPQISSISSAWELVRNADSQASLQPGESEAVGMGPSNPCLTSPPGDSDARL